MTVIKTIIVYLLIILITVLPTYVLVRYAKSFPPKFLHPKYKSGFGGMLIILLFGQVVWLVRSIWETSYMASDLFFMIRQTPELTVSASVVLLPSLLGLLFGGMVIYQLVSKRTPAAFGAVIVMLWLMGPSVAMFQSWYFQLALTQASIIQLFGWTIFWSLYLVISPRSTLTYGTARGRKYMEESR